MASPDKPQFLHLLVASEREHSPETIIIPSAFFDETRRIKEGDHLFEVYADFVPQSFPFGLQSALIPDIDVMFNTIADYNLGRNGGEKIVQSSNRVIKGEGPVHGFTAGVLGGKLSPGVSIALVEGMIAGMVDLQTEFFAPRDVLALATKSSANKKIEASLDGECSMIESNEDDIGWSAVTHNGQRWLSGRVYDLKRIADDVDEKFGKDVTQEFLDFGFPFYSSSMMRVGQYISDGLKRVKIHETPSRVLTDDGQYVQSAQQYHDYLISQFSNPIGIDNRRRTPAKSGNIITWRNLGYAVAGAAGAASLAGIGFKIWKETHKKPQK